MFVSQPIVFTEEIVVLLAYQFGSKNY